MDRKRIIFDTETFPEEVRLLIGNADLYDSSSSGDARVFFIDREEGFFLKRAASGTLSREARMTEVFHGLGLTAGLLSYVSSGGYDYLLTERVPGEDCVHPDHLADPVRLADILGERLRALHDLQVEGSPGEDLTALFVRSVREGLEAGCFSPKKYRGLWDFSSEREAREEAGRGIDSLRGDVLIHGDYCLPNVLLRGWRFSGFVDLGLAGMGDPHVDLMWGIWSLRYNLKTDRFTDRFLDAYGRDRVDEEMLRRVAAMNAVAL